MPLQSSGTISFSNIQVEFGSAFRSMSNCYGIASNVPVSGPIFISHLYGKGAYAPAIVAPTVSNINTGSGAQSGTWELSNNVTDTYGRPLTYTTQSYNASHFSAASNVASKLYYGFPLNKFAQSTPATLKVVNRFGRSNTIAPSFTVIGQAIAATSLGSASISNNTVTYALGSYFTEYSSNGLGYTLTANPNANASISGSTLSVAGSNRGTTYTVSVSASNAYNQTASTSLSVTEASGLPLPVTSGLVGYYTGESVIGLQWTDLSGSGNHVTSFSGIISTATFPGTSKSYLYGPSTSTMTFPSAILPSLYTLFYVAKYNGSSKGRIFNSTSTNWLSGFHNGKAGVAYHMNWITAETDIHGTNWFQGTDQNSLFRSGKVSRTIANGGIPSSGALSINSYVGEQSDWAIATVIVYNRLLTNAEYTSVENYLETTYPIPSIVTNRLFTNGTSGWTSATGWGTYGSGNQPAVVVNDSGQPSGYQSYVAFSYSAGQSVSQTISISSPQSSWTFGFSVRSIWLNADINDTYSAYVTFYNSSSQVVETVGASSSTSLGSTTWTDYSFTSTSNLSTATSAIITLIGQDMGSWGGQYGPSFTRISLS